MADATRVPIWTPVLKGKKHVFFDTVKLKKDGPQQTVLFNDFRRFPDSEDKKFGTDCNFALSCQLGYPLTFDLVMWSIVFEEFGSGEDIRQILSKLNVGLIAASQRPIHNSVGSQFYPGVLLTDGHGRDWVTTQKGPMRNAPRNYRRTVKNLRGQIGQAARIGTWTHWYQPLDINRKARRVESTDIFCVEMAVAPVTMSAPAQFKVGLHGILYAP
jgi:hypothetical protein